MLGGSNVGGIETDIVESLAIKWNVLISVREQSPCPHPVQFLQFGNGKRLIMQTLAEVWNRLMLQQRILQQKDRGSHSTLVKSHFSLAFGVQGDGRIAPDRQTHRQGPSHTPV